MVESIKEFGVVQPIVVRPVGTEYEIIAGERRWRAALKAGTERIPAVIRESTETDSLEMALIENLHREDLNGIEEAFAYQQLLEDFAITHEELSRKLGKSRVSITNTVRLLQLPPQIQREVMEGNISTGHARALLSLQGEPGLQDELCSRIVSEGLSVRQTEQLAGAAKDEENARTPAPKERARSPLPQEALDIFERIGERVDARVKGSIGKNKGRLTIEFKDLEDLRRIYELIAGDSSLPEGESHRQDE